MNIKVFILILLIATGVSPQVWGPPVKWDTGWVRSRIVSANEGLFSIHINGGIPQRELANLGYSDLGGGNSRKGYFRFLGGAYRDSETNAYRSYILYPPQRITGNDISSGSNNSYDFRYSMLSNTTESASDDFDYITEGFGYWNNLGRDENNSQLFSGHLIAMTIAKRSLSQPSEINRPEKPLNNIEFVDSLYKVYVDRKSLSAKSPIFMQARIHDCDSAFALMSVSGGPIFRFRLVPDSINPVIFRGKCNRFIDNDAVKLKRIVLQSEIYIKR